MGVLPDAELVPQEEDGLRASLGEAHRRYTRHVKSRQAWRGHLWQERFHSFVMDERYLLATVPYVERNPVTAGLCRNAGEWGWPSAVAHLTGNDDGIVTVRPMLDRIPDWAAYVAAEDPSGEEAARIKQHSKTGRPVGDKSFVTCLEALTGRTLQPQMPGRKSAVGK